IEGELEAALEETSATAVEDSYREQLAAMRRQDAAAGRTLAGPHRSDLAVTHLGKGIAAALASTGEQKALLIGLTLAHADIVSRAEGRERPPILLLDEIAAHLDDLRRAALYERLLDLECQAWMTGTDRALFTAISDAAQLFEIAGGMVQPWD
ncbi:MAG: DNA replication and repair protein RecF, partial [Nitratireductor sp.]|nr:DNA replication and repair protein RecF [Nitratireductor sp.]